MAAIQITTLLGFLVAMSELFRGGRRGLLQPWGPISEPIITGFNTRTLQPLSTDSDLALNLLFYNKPFVARRNF